MSDSADRRRFWRAGFRANVQLTGDAAAIPAELIDISLNGALVEVHGLWLAHAGDACRLVLSLGEDAAISMETVVAHVQGSRVGLGCVDIDVESITHLRRLVELNAGDPALLDRELAALVG